MSRYMGLEDIPFGRFAVDCEGDLWEHTDEGFVFRGADADGVAVSMDTLSDWGYGPYTLLNIENAVVTEPVIATVDDVKVGAVIEFVYTWTVTTGLGTYAGAGEATVDSVNDWIKHPKANCVARLVKVAPNPIDEKVAGLKAYAEAVGFEVTDWQMKFLAGYLLSLEDK